MNFHPDKQLFQVAGAGDRTADPWVTSPTLPPPPYTMGDFLPTLLIMFIYLGLLISLESQSRNVNLKKKWKKDLRKSLVPKRMYRTKVES